MVFVGFDAQALVKDKFDPYFFGEMGKSLARGEGFAPYGSLLMRRSPLYPFLIGGIYLAFGESPRLVQIAQCLMLAGTCWLVFDMGRRLGNLRTGVLAGVACALHPMMLRYVADLHLETMLTFLVTLMVWCTVRFHTAPTVRNGVVFGVVAGLAALTKAVMLLYPVGVPGHVDPAAPHWPFAGTLTIVLGDGRRRLVDGCRHRAVDRPELLCDAR